MIKIKCLGASHEVGRSGFAINYENSDVLLDYGVKIGKDAMEYPMHPDSIIKHIILSHSHLDHCGMIPWLFQKYRPTVYLTAPSLDIAEILWEDSLKIAKIEGNQLPFSKQNIQDVFGAMNIVNYKQKIQIAENISFELFDAGHIIGSAITKLQLGKKSLIYTGDYKLEESSLHQGADIDIDNPNYLIIESTYGDRDHPKRKDVEKEFIENVNLILENGGSVILPAFAVGRSQE
ncbi:MAG: MBL fold metallo-hydrolase, partial [Candidatus Diapherotrites archaeon CG08_land_8_20_14_0_20_30_16]